MLQLFFDSGFLLDQVVAVKYPDSGASTNLHLHGGALNSATTTSTPEGGPEFDLTLWPCDGWQPVMPKRVYPAYCSRRRASNPPSMVHQASLDNKDSELRVLYGTTCCFCMYNLNHMQMNGFIVGAKGAVSSMLLLASSLNVWAFHSLLFLSYIYHNWSLGLVSFVVLPQLSGHILVNYPSCINGLRFRAHS